MKPALENRRPLTESPWYWAYLFCTGALIALVMIGPKYIERQSRIEQNGQKRQWAAQVAAGRSEAAGPAPRQGLAVALWPLFVVLGLLLSVAWIKLIRNHLQRRPTAAPPTAPRPGAADSRSAADAPGER